MSTRASVSLRDFIGEQEQQKQEVIEKIENLNRSLESKTTLSLGLRSDIVKLQALVQQAEFDVEQELSSCG